MARNRQSGLLARAERAASALRPIERRVLLLCARDKLPIEEIAARLGMTPRSARRLLERSLRRFDRALQRMERDWWRIL